MNVVKMQMNQLVEMLVISGCSIVSYMVKCVYRCIVRCMCTCVCYDRYSGCPYLWIPTKL